MAAVAEEDDPPMAWGSGFNELEVWNARMSVLETSPTDAGLWEETRRDERGYFLSYRTCLPPT